MGNLLQEAIESQDTLSIELYRDQVSSYEESLQNGLDQRKSQWHRIINDLENELREYESQLKALQYSLEQLDIKSPVNGFINSLLVNYTGEVLSTGQSVMTIVPESPLNFECFILDRDRASISVGDEVTLKISAFSYSQYGAVHGKVRHISSSAFSNEKLGNVYSVIIDIDMESINEGIEFVSGLSGSVEIIVGNRSVLDYFLEPLKKGVGGSLRES